MKKTQEQINELADVYYDGMASVLDRFDKINKVDETNAYIKKRYGSEPSDSELEIEGTLEEPTEIRMEAYAIKWIALFFGLLFFSLQWMFMDNIVLSVGALVTSAVFICTFFIMCHIEKFLGR